MTTPHPCPNCSEWVTPGTGHVCRWREQGAGTRSEHSAAMLRLVRSEARVALERIDHAICVLHADGRREDAEALTRARDALVRAVAAAVAPLGERAEVAV